ncbi:MAG: DUF448 domain-containing protein [Escherichia coli]|nr:MAG: DUF448 domain-containing protein [Escherichia coli]
MKEKHIPMRMCSGCRERFEKNSLIRVVKSPEGDISIDKTGKKSGRGAYICNNEKCLTLAIKKHSLENVFKMKIDDDIFEQLKKEINNE